MDKYQELRLEYLVKKENQQRFPKMNSLFLDQTAYIGIHEYQNITTHAFYILKYLGLEKEFGSLTKNHFLKTKERNIADCCYDLRYPLSILGVPSFFLKTKEKLKADLREFSPHFDCIDVSMEIQSM